MPFHLQNPPRQTPPPSVGTSNEDKPPSIDAQADPLTKNSESNEDQAAPAHAQVVSHPISPVVEAHQRQKLAN